MRSYSEWLTKEFLEQEYVEKDKDISQISKENNCSISTVSRYLTKYNIETFPSGIKGKLKLNEKRCGKLIAVEDLGRIKEGQRDHFWRCVCDCGGEKILSASQIQCEVVISCGCLLNPPGQDSNHWKGGRFLSKTFWNSVINGAKTRNLPFDITIDYAETLLEKQNFRCALSGTQLVVIPSVRSSDRLKHTASIDRIDSYLGYIIGNIQWVHKNINCMKYTLTNEEFAVICKRIYEYQLEIGTYENLDNFDISDLTVLRRKRNNINGSQE